MADVFDGKGSRTMINIVGIIIFIGILFTIDIAKSIDLLAHTRLSCAAVVFILSIPVLWLKSWRWRFLLGMQDINCRMTFIFTAVLSSIYLGLLTPGRLGEFSKVYFLKKEHPMAIGEAFSSVLIDRFLDLLLLIVVGFSGVVILSMGADWILVIAGSLTVALTAGYILLNVNFSRKIFQLFLKWPWIAKIADRYDLKDSGFLSSLEKLRRVKLLIPVLATCVAYLVFFYQCFLMAVALDIQITFLQVVYCISVANVVALIPISIYGIGTRDAVLIYLFSILGLGREEAVGFSLLFLIIQYGSTALFGGIAWLSKK
jgi:uncharacterized protein (TIRG00374 family)